jgi:hypothetical protein
MGGFRKSAGGLAATGYRRRACGALAATALLALAVAAGEAEAQSDLRYAYPEQLTVSPMGVNLQTGRLAYVKQDLAIGPLSLVRSWGDSSAFPGPAFGSYVRTKSYVTGWTHSLNQGVAPNITMSGGDYREVVVDRKRYSFVVLNTGAIQPWSSSAQGALLESTGGGYSLTNQAGARYTFITKSGTTAVLGKAEYPDGRTADYSYTSDFKLRNVVSSNGYAIVLDYDSGGNVGTACAYNTTVQFVGASTTCAGAALKVTYGYGSGGTSLTSVTDVRGNVVQMLGYATMGGPLCMTLPNTSACELQNAFGDQPGDPAGLGTPKDVVRVQTAANGQVWRYSYDFGENPVDVPIVAGQPRFTSTEMTDPANKTTVAFFDRGVLVDLYQPSGLTNYKYQVLTQNTPSVNWDYHVTSPSFVTHPEGNREYYQYDPRGNVIRHASWPKGAAPPTYPASTNPDMARCCVGPDFQGSRPGEATFTQSFPHSYFTSYFPSGCGSGAADAKRCDKPTARIDARSNQTDYTYDPAHGGVLTETGPAVNGVRPQTRYSYVQRHAWVKNTGGGYSPSAIPIWLVSTRSLCKTSAATGNPASPCAAGAGDEVRTAFEYGLDSGPSNLLPAGVAEDVTGTPRRSCYGYDWMGNRTREFKPRGTVAMSACP